MMFARDPKWRLLGALDLVALAAVAGSSVWGLAVAPGLAWFYAPALVFVILWAYKAWVLTDVLGVWFPARFGMNGGRVYEVSVPWALAALSVVAVVLWVAVEAALSGNVPGALAPLPLAAALGRAAVPHTVMGWLEARRMTSVPPGGE